VRGLQLAQQLLSLLAVGPLTLHHLGHGRGQNERDAEEQIGVQQCRVVQPGRLSRREMVGEPGEQPGAEAAPTRWPKRKAAAVIVREDSLVSFLVTYRGTQLMPMGCGGRRPPRIPVSGAVRSSRTAPEKNTLPTFYSEVQRY
jgi:hypothetical protein